MKIQLFSDLHLEFYRNFPELGRVEAHPDADVVVLAGDIDVGEAALTQARDLAKRSGKKVIYVPGNHEFYHHDIDELSKHFTDTPVEDVFVLMNNTVIIDGVRFCGGTLWTDFELYEKSVRMSDIREAFRVGNAGIADFTRIAKGMGRFTAQTSRMYHDVTKEYLTEVLDSAFDGPTVVVTHHAPHQKSIDVKYSPGERVLAANHQLPNENQFWKLNVCFASNLGYLVEKADFWLHGHVHDSFDYHVGKCRVIANPRGYPRKGEGGRLVFENPKYNPVKLIEV